MISKRTLVAIGLIGSVVGIILWLGLDAVMRGVAEMEQNTGGVQQAVRNGN